MIRIPESVGFAAVDVGDDSCKKAIFRQARRYHIASLQDKNPVIAVRHNGYAIGLIGVLKDVSDEAEVKRLTGESLQKLWLEATAVQDRMESEVFKLLEQLKKLGIQIPF